MHLRILATALKRTYKRKNHKVVFQNKEDKKKTKTQKKKWKEKKNKIVHHQRDPLLELRASAFF